MQTGRICYPFVLTFPSSSFIGIAFHSHWHSYHLSHTNMAIHIYMEEPRSLTSLPYTCPCLHTWSLAVHRSRLFMSIHAFTSPCCFAFAFILYMLLRVSLSRSPSANVSFETHSPHPRLRRRLPVYPPLHFPRLSKETFPPDHVHAVSRTLLPCTRLSSLLPKSRPERTPPRHTLACTKLGASHSPPCGGI